jgi:single-stranded-DNA-specific exonuclease
MVSSIAEKAPLSLTGRRWVLRDPKVASPLGLVDRLMKQRGIESDPAAKISDPMLLPEMSPALKRIDKAIASKQTIAIFGDYDADGITAAALLIRCLRRRGIDPLVHLPDRLKEGYGMKRESIDALHRKGAKLIITVDTGISAHAEIKHAMSLGIDVIVTDHHRPLQGRPPALAVLHPQVPSAFPNQHLCGAGVAFMLVRALEGGQVWRGVEEDIALAAIGTVGDLVPLVGENRILVEHGLRFLCDLPPGPLRSFVDDIAGSAPLTSSDIAFRIVPRINAAGRMEHPMLALKALLGDDPDRTVLHRLNDDRREAIETALELVRPMVDPQHAFIVLASDQFTPGIVGLIAGRLTEEFGRPSLIAADLNGNCIASLRSIEAVDILSCLQDPSVRPLLTTFGGHTQAAGCTFDASKTSALSQALNSVLEFRGFSASDLCPELRLDYELDPDHVSMHLVTELQRLEPCGMGNQQPTFLLRNLRIKNLKTVGADGAHLQLDLGFTRGIAFSMGHLAETLASCDRIDIACGLSVNTWNGRDQLQLLIRDLRKSAD